MGNLRLCVPGPEMWNVGLDREKPVVLIGAWPAAAEDGDTNVQTIYKESQTHDP